MGLRCNNRRAGTTIHIRAGTGRAGAGRAGAGRTATLSRLKPARPPELYYSPEVRRAVPRPFSAGARLGSAVGATFHRGTGGRRKRAELGALRKQSCRQTVFNLAQLCLRKLGQSFSKSQFGATLLAPSCPFPALFLHSACAGNSQGKALSRQAGRESAANAADNIVRLSVV